MHRNHLLHSARLMAAAVMLSIVAACAQVGVPTPDTFNKSLAVAVAVNTEVRSTATSLLQSGKITVADAENIQRQADYARQGLEVARSMSGIDQPGANAKLIAANAVLQALQQYLATKGAK